MIWLRFLERYMLWLLWLRFLEQCIHVPQQKFDASHEDPVAQGFTVEHNVQAY